MWLYFEAVLRMECVMRYLSVAFLSALTALSLAAPGEQIMCPGTLKFVTMGDSVSAVIATCGQPLKTLSKNIKPANAAGNSGANTRWYYSNMISQDAKAINNGMVTFNGSGVVVAIEGGNGSTMQCQNGTIKIGASMNTVSRMCGLPQAQATDNQLKGVMAQSHVGGVNPTYTTNNTLRGMPAAGPGTAEQQSLKNDANALQGKHSMTILIYQAESYTPKIALTFFDNQLAQSGRVTSEPSQ
jgi:hypothetical protein